MAIFGLNLAVTKTFESELDPAKGTPEATRFTIGALDARIWGHIADKATEFHVESGSDRSGNAVESVTTSVNANEVAFNRVMFALRGWENFKDKDGNDITFRTVKRNVAGKSYEVASPEVVALIPAAVIREIAEAVSEANEISEEERKN